MDRVPKISYVTTITLLLYTYFQWEIMSSPLVFFVVFIVPVLYAVGFFALVASILYLFKRWKSLEYKAAVPFGVCFLGFLVLMTFPFVEIKIHIDFFRYESQMEQVVEMIDNAELLPNVEYNRTMIHLPSKYRHLSKGGGDIKFGDGYVFFYTFRGILDNFSGYIYGEADPQSDLGCGVIDNIILNDNWRWVSCS